MSSEPRITVLLAVRNGMPYLPHTVASVLGQTFADFELLALDSGSTDDTPQFLQSVDDPRVIYHRVDRGSLAGVRQFGVETARATLVAVIDADDLACPTRFAEQFAYMTGHPHTSAFGSQAEEIDEQGAPRGARRYPTCDTAIRWRMFFGCPILQPSCMLRREHVLACGGYRAGMNNAEDYDLFARLAQVGKLANHPAPLLKYRIHARSMTEVHRQEQTELCSGIAAQYAAGWLAGLDPDAVADLHYLLAAGRDPRTTGYDQVLAAYLRIKTEFLRQSGPPCEELHYWIAVGQRTLRWHCLERAEAAWCNPARAWAWLRLARAFDPENASVPQMVSRWVRRRMPRRGP